MRVARVEALARASANTLDPVLVTVPYNFTVITDHWSPALTGGFAKPFQETRNTESSGFRTERYCAGF